MDPFSYSFGPAFTALQIPSSSRSVAFSGAVAPAIKLQAASPMHLGIVASVTAGTHKQVTAIAAAPLIAVFGASLDIRA